MHSNHQQIPKVVKLDLEMKERLDQLGQIKNRSAHWLMKEAIRLYLEQEEYNEKLKVETNARWQEAENGKVVSHQAVVKWLASWGAKDEEDRPPCEK